MSERDELSFVGFTAEELEVLLELVPPYQTFKNEAEQRVARIRAKLVRARGLLSCLPTDEQERP